MKSRNMVSKHLKLFAQKKIFSYTYFLTGTYNHLFIENYNKYLLIILFI